MSDLIQRLEDYKVLLENLAAFKKTMLKGFSATQKDKDNAKASCPHARLVKEAIARIKELEGGEKVSLLSDTLTRQRGN